MLAQNTNIDIDKIRNILMELIKARKLTDKYAHLKVTMEPFMLGDYVRLKKSTYDKLQKKPFYTNNVFKIKSLDNKNIEVYDVDDKLEISEVEPIPIDGIADKDLYYAPITMANPMFPLQPNQDSRTDDSYYMDEMKNCTDIDERIFYDKIQQRICQYVHEVQHFLKEEEEGDDGLRLNFDIRN